MKYTALRFLTVFLLVMAMAIPLFACTGSETPEETTVITDEVTDEPTEESTEAITEEITEAETAEPLPTEIDLPEAYKTADIVYNCNDGSVLHNYTGKTDADFAAVCAYYTEQGFQVYSSRNMAENTVATFVGDGPMAHVYWIKAKGELNIVLSDTAASTLPPMAPEVTDGEYECSVIQLKDNTNVNGMSYIIQLKDGSYIVYDGSYSGQARKLTKYMQDNYHGEGKPIVRAWVLTHSHNDHYPTFQTVARRMENTVKVEYIIYSPINRENYELNEEESYFGSEDFFADVAQFEGARLVYAHTGMDFTFCNLKMEVLMTPETLFKGGEPKGNFNNTSVVTRLYDEDYSALFLGDIAVKGSTYIHEIYGSYLKSDMCQVSHHGVEDVPLSFYEEVQASILYYPCNIWLYDQTERHYDVRVALENRDYTKEILIAGCGEYKRAWGTKFAADAPLSMPDYTVPAHKQPGAETDTKEEFPVDPSILSTDKTTYKVGEPIMITAVGSGNDWVGVAVEGGGSSLRWWCLSDGYGYAWVEPGVPFDALSTPANYNSTSDLVPGEYLIVLIPDDKPFASGDYLATVTIVITE